MPYAGNQVSMLPQPALTFRPKSILFATDFSFESERALRHAIVLARHYAASLQIAHVVSSVGINLAGPDAIGCAQDAAARDLQTLEEKLRSNDWPKQLSLATSVRRGDVCAELKYLIDEWFIDLVVIGTHGRRGLGRLLLGSVAEEIVRTATCPVVTVGPDFRLSGVENQREPRPILVATDFHDASEKAACYAEDFACERGAPLILLHVIPLLPKPRVGEWPQGMSLEDRRRSTDREAYAKLAPAVERMQSRNCRAQAVVRCGDPAEEILKIAAELRTDGIAIGLHAVDHPEAVSHFRRTVAYKVISGAQCAVLSVRE